MISYDGIPESKLVLGLYKGSSALGTGFLHDKYGLTEDEVKEDLVDIVENSPPGRISFDYYRGHPFKTALNTKDKTFEERLYDRDAGHGQAQRVVDQLRARIEP